LRLRPVALALSAGILATVAPAHASGPKPQITDETGDANGINSQGFNLGIEPQQRTEPVNVAGADIVSVLFATNFATKKSHGKKVKAPNGFTVTLSLAAAPTTDIVYRVSGAVAKCSNVFFEYDTAPGATVTADARCPGPTPLQDTSYDVSGSANGQKITWVVPDGVFRNGTVFSSLTAQTRTVAVRVTAPQIDYASSAATYTVGK
jgi:hypothetical protein